jgi:hypothetical protein
VKNFIGEIFKFRASEKPFLGFWERFDRILMVRKQCYSLQLAAPSSPGPVNKYELQNFIRKLQGICMESLTDGKYIFCF